MQNSCMHRFGFLILIFLSSRLFAQPVIQLVEYASGFSDPVDIASAGDGRLFIVERPGYIKIIDSLGNVLPDDFLDIHSEIESGYQEQGLLGLAFHPDYASNGYFFVNYTDVDGNTVIARFTKSTFDDNIADPTTEEIIYTAIQPFVNHNGGCVKFGPDGYLYFGLGDGGSGGDPGNRAQNPENKLGKMHRINVDGALPYEIPADNPFVTAIDTLPEIWAIGYRNPWRFTFDLLNDDMWIGDVGQNLIEEVDIEPAGSTGGNNYGWRCYEANDEFNDAGCGDIGDYKFPILDYPHNMSTGGFAVTGGYVYRGSLYPGMYGYYLCADFVSGNWWWIYPDGAGGWMNDRMDDVQLDVSSFGQDNHGELYCTELYSGQIFHITDACGDFAISATATDYICGVQDGSIDLTINAGTEPYLIDWSTGSTEEDITVNAGGIYSVTVTDDGGCERMINVVVNETPAFIPAINYDAPTNTLSTDLGVSWQWYLNGELIDGATAMTYSPTEDGNYSVMVTDANGCSEMSEEIAVIVTAVSNTNVLSMVSVFPVPVINELNVEIQSAEFIASATISITDINGKIILTKTSDLNAGINLFLFDLQASANGVYFLNLVAGENNSYTCFVK